MQKRTVFSRVRRRLVVIAHAPLCLVLNFAALFGCGPVPVPAPAKCFFQPGPQGEPRGEVICLHPVVMDPLIVVR